MQRALLSRTGSPRQRSQGRQSFHALRELRTQSTETTCLDTAHGLPYREACICVRIVLVIRLEQGHPMFESNYHDIHTKREKHEANFKCSKYHTNIATWRAMQRNERRGDSPRCAKTTDRPHGDWISHDFLFLLRCEFLTFFAANTQSTLQCSSRGVKGFKLHGLSVAGEMAINQRLSVSGSHNVCVDPNREITVMWLTGRHMGPP